MSIYETFSVIRKLDIEFARGYRSAVAMKSSQHGSKAEDDGFQVFRPRDEGELKFDPT